MDKKLHDITTENDVAFLVKTFYDRVLQDELLAPYFSQVDFEQHVPRIIAFWNFVLLDKAGYTGNVFDKHANLPINETHFNRWIMHFAAVLHDFFEGEKASLAKQRAESLKFIFLSKMNK